MQAVDATDSAGNDSAPPLPNTPAVAAGDAARTTELPDKPIQVSKPVEPVRDATPKSRVGLLLLLLLVVVVAGAAAMYTLNLFDIRTKLGLEKAAETITPEEEAPTPVPPPEKKPELPSATLVLGEAPVVEFKAEEKGSLATIVATETEVKEGDVVAKLTGTAGIDKQIAAHKLRQEHYQGKLDKATSSKEEAEKDGNAGAARKYQSEVDGYQKKVDEKQELVEAEEKKLEAFLFKAPAGGRVETSLKDGDSFEAGDVVFSIKGEPPLQATFTVKEDYAKDAEVEIVAKADDKKRLDCKVIQVEGENITVECASGGALSADEEAILRP
jgi:biotin carboxyl carrier protein